MDWRSLHGDGFEGQGVLVTGAAGFIGSHLVEALAELGAEVVALDSLEQGDWANIEEAAAAVRRVTGTIEDPATLTGAVGGCRWVFHLAGYGSVPRSVDDPDLYLRANAIGTFNVLQAAKGAGVERVIFSGSSNYYGHGARPAGPRVESEPPMTLSPYAATKLFGEGCMRAWSHSFALDTTVLRYFNIFGPRQNPASDYAAVIAAFAAALQAGRRPTIFGDGEQTRDWTYVANAVHANLLAARCGKPLMGEPFNVGGGGSISVNQLYRTMAGLFERGDLLPEYAPPREGEVRHSRADLHKSSQVLGYEPIVGFEAGLEQTVRWYQQALSAEGS